MTTRNAVSQVVENLRTMVHIEVMPNHLRGQLAVAVVILEDLAKEYDKAMEDLTTMVHLSTSISTTTRSGRITVENVAKRIKSTLPVS